MIQPDFLKAGDRIAITCPSGRLPIEKALRAKKVLEQWGFEVVIGDTVGSAYFYFSQSDERRLQDLQAHLDDPKVKAIIAGRGGYGLSRIIDQIDFRRFLKKPKWVVGFSDITVLHSHLNNVLGVMSIHGPMCAAFEIGHEAANLALLRDMLTGGPFNYPIPTNNQNKPGSAEGVLIGGNLAILAHLTGSISALKPEGSILFLEDVGEYLYNIDRMLLTLKRAHVFGQVAGLICGGFTDLKDTVRPFGSNLYEIVLDLTKGHDFPICFDFPAGHIEDNYPLMLGKKHRLLVGASSHLAAFG